MEEQIKSPKTFLKQGSVGCGVLIAVLLILLILVAIGGNEAAGYYFKNCQDRELFSCFFSKLEEPEPERAVTATGTYTFKGYSANATMKIPLAGGAVTGTVTGACSGNIKGSFEGKNKGVISGKMSGYCDPFFIKIPASAKFGGIVNKDGKVVPISFDGSGGGLSHKDSISLTY